MINRVESLAPSRAVNLWARVALSGFAVLAVCVYIVGLLPGDLEGLEFFKSHRIPGQSLFAAIGSMHDGPQGWIGFVALTLVVGWIYRARLRPFALVAVMGGGVIWEETFKILVHRMRPSGETFGFPSGHAGASLTLIILVLATLWNTLSARAKVLGVFVGGAFVLGVTVTRMAAGLHWPSDILGGWLMAVAYAIWTLPYVQRPANLATSQAGLLSE